MEKRYESGVDQGSNLVPGSDDVSRCAFVEQGLVEMELGASVHLDRLGQRRTDKVKSVAAAVAGKICIGGVEDTNEGGVAIEVDRSVAGHSVVMKVLGLAAACEIVGVGTK